jgi:uncharacterized protein involved in exopolysaccharide biosynthesis
MRTSDPSDPDTTWKRFLDFAWRWKVWIILTTVLSGATSVAIVAMMPKSYRATTAVLVREQRVPDTLVRGAVTLRLEERLKNLQVQLFNRSYLEQIAREFTLVAADANEAAIERACLELRERVSSEINGQGVSWFKISVIDRDPGRAAGIANRLAELFVQQNSRLRLSQADGTLAMTENWELRYRTELASRDARIAEFQRQNLYVRPGQQEIELQLLSSAQFRVGQLTDAIRTREDQLAALRAAPSGSAVPEFSPTSARSDADLLNDQLTVLLASYTTENPLVKRQQARIAALGPPPPAVTVVDTSTFRRLATIEEEIKTLESDRERESANIASYRARIDEAPYLQEQLSELNRGYDQVKRQFDTAVAQTEQAQRSRDLEESSQGEQFQVQDLAYPPAIPYRPNVVRFVIGGLGVGLLLGMGIGGSREFVVQTVRGESQFAARFPELPVYGVIPSFELVPGPHGRPCAAVRTHGGRNS